MKSIHLLLKIQPTERIRQITIKYMVKNRGGWEGDLSIGGGGGCVKAFLVP